jgi:hypothetical protein
MATNLAELDRPSSTSPLDSPEKLLADVLREMDTSLSAMSDRDRENAVTEIHAIAENVRLRQER